ncbi:MAG: type II toxin-antitoxin system VapC family toxin [Myxococcota bacterium]
MLVDTDVLIWYMRGNPKAARALESLPDRALSAVTYMELVEGLRNKAELKALRKTLSAWNARVLPITEDISTRAMFFVELHFHSASVRMADALIGATAVSNGLTLLTANDKHFRPLGGVDIQRFRP